MVHNNEPNIMNHTGPFRRITQTQGCVNFCHSIKAEVNASSWGKCFLIILFLFLL